MDRKQVCAGMAMAMGLWAGSAAAEEWEGIQIMPGVQAGVLVEVEASHEKQDGEEASD